MIARPAFAASVDLPAGSTIDGTVQQDLSSRTAEDGQTFTVLTSSGSHIYGHLSQVVRATPTRKAHLKLNLDRIRFSDGTVAPLDAEIIGVTQNRRTNYVQAAGQVLGGMIVGNIIGKAVGTNLGGLVGVAGGGLLAANTASNIEIPAGSPMRVRLNAPLVVRPQAR